MVDHDMVEGLENEGSRRCRGTNMDGTACNAPSQWVSASSGYCLTHDPDRETERQAARMLGGRRTQAKHRQGLHPDDLPPLDSPEAAEKWSAIIAQAVATGTLSSAQGRAVMHAVSQFMRAHAEGKTMQRLQRLESALKNGRR